MSIILSREEGFILNTVGAGETPESILEFFSENFKNWEKSPVLWDMREFNFNNFTTSNIHTILDGTFPLAKVRASLKTAFLVNSDLAFGMMRMLQLFAELKSEIIFKVFMDFHEAVRWLKT